MVIVQSDSFSGTNSVTICIFTTNESEAPLIRLRIEPNERNELDASSRIMVDKITTVPKRKIGRRIGELDSEDIERLDQAMATFLGLTASQESMC